MRLSDTTGMANPAQVRRLFHRVRAEIGERTGAAHMHNTRGLGLANCLAAWDVGVRTFDASLGGLGGCPYAPGASGNVVTEDLVFMFESMGIATGINLEKLIAARTPLQATARSRLRHDAEAAYRATSSRPHEMRMAEATSLESAWSVHAHGDGTCGLILPTSAPT